ncbi:glycosyl transferase [Echinicola pacifica]|uniref:Glycosyl transferase n=1 Tax=Echinicola pacifica TaxID=346377 RepID=A0A918QA66_9BACT|nr:glycosyltransferase family 2 protein [Echinicola pacifica]GGZ38908.1 glycosyl transferase [Echinicola pacifica]
MRKAAIVILNYNGKEMLRQFLPTLLTESFFEIIIADNHSSDDSIDFLARHYPDLQVLALSQNYGYSKGYNEALARLQGAYEYFVLLNSDVKVSPLWDRSLVDFLDAHPDHVAVQPKILSFQNPNQYDYAGAGGGFIDQLGYPYCRGRILDEIEEDRGQYDDTLEVSWTSGACFALRAEAFFEEQGFDDEFFAHMEEIDLCWRWTMAGWKLGYLGKVSVYHLGGGTLSRTSSFKTYLNMRNNLLMLYKNLHSSRFLLLFVLRMGMDSFAGLYLALTGKGDQTKAVLKGYRDFFKMKSKIKKSKYLASKLPSQAENRRSYINSIVIKYYLAGKKRYQEL